MARARAPTKLHGVPPVAPRVSPQWRATQRDFCHKNNGAMICICVSRGHSRRQQSMQAIWRTGANPMGEASRGCTQRLSPALSFRCLRWRRASCLACFVSRQACPVSTFHTFSETTRSGNAPSPLVFGASVPGGLCFARSRRTVALRRAASRSSRARSGARTLCNPPGRQRTAFKWAGSQLCKGPAEKRARAGGIAR